MRDKALDAIATFVLKRPLVVVLAALALAVLGGLLAGAKLRLNADTNDLIARDRPYMGEFLRMLGEFGDLEYLYAVVEKTDSISEERARAVADDLTRRLRDIPGLPGVYATVSTAEQLRLATRAMSDDQLRGLASASGIFSPVLAGAGPGALVRAADEHLLALVQRGAALPTDEQRRLGAEAVFALRAALTGLPGSSSAEALGPLAGHAADRYLTSDSGRMFFITIKPDKDYGTLGVIEEPLQRIRAAIAETRAAFPDIPVGLTGKPVLQADEMATSNRDMLRASLIAVFGCALIVIVMLRGVVRPLLALASLAIAAGWTYGAATLLVGQLNLLSIVFMLVLIGVGMDYGVHVISRFREIRSHEPLDAAVHGAIRLAGRGNLTGAATSAGVFFTALLTNFQGLRELGLIAGIGLVFCFISMTVVLPALLVLIDDRMRLVTPPPGYEHTSRLRFLERLSTRHPGWVMGAAVVVSLALLAAPGVMRFEQNLLKLQAEGLDSVQWERRIQRDSAAATWFGAVILDSADQIPGVIEAARARPTIGAVRSVLDFVQPETPQRNAWRDRLHERDDPAPLDDRPLSPDELDLAASRLEAIAAGARATGAAREAVELGALLDDLRRAAGSLRADPDATLAALDAGLMPVRAALREVLEGDRLTLREALPGAVREQFVSPSGLHLVMLHPRENVWDYDAMGAFIADMRAVNPRVTGVPITHYESIGEMRTAFITMTLLAFGFVCLVLLADFRRLRDAAVCLIPLVIGMVWTVSAMGILGVSFNLANFFAFPILLGLSVDAGVHILHRYLEGGESRFHLGATRRAVMLTSLTTMIGFGALIIAQHRGLQSLGIAMAIGTAACLLAAVLVLPSALALLERNGNGAASDDEGSKLAA